MPTHVNLLSQITNAIVLLPAVYVFTLMWLIPDGEKYVPGLILLACIFGCGGVIAKKKQYQVLTNQRPFLLALTSLTAYGLLTYFWKGESWTTLRAFTAITLYAWLISGQTFKTHHVRLLLLISGGCLSAISAYQAASGYDRISGFINPIPFATALATMTLLIALITVRTSHLAIKLIGAALVLLLFISTLLTQTRGVIVPIILIGLAGVTFKLLTSKIKLAGKVSIGLLIGLSAFLTTITAIEDRIDHTLSEMQRIQSGDLSSSIGLRIQMWSASIKLVSDKPLLGHGDLHESALAKLEAKGKVDESLFQYSPSHYHNQFLDFLVKQGAIGLALLLLTISLGLRAVYLNSFEPKAWLPAVLIVLTYVAASLSDVPLRHPNTIYMFIVSLIMLSAISQSEIPSPKSNLLEAQ